MRKILGPGLLFLLCLCVALVLNMPLVHILAQVNFPKQIRLANVQGTLLGGQIDILEVNRLQATNINYDSDFSCLLKLQMCYRMNFDQGRVSLSAGLLDQSLALSDVSISYPMEDLAVLSQSLLVKPSGNLQLNIESASLKQEKIGIRKATAVWANAGVVGESFNLGEYQLSINSANQSYQFELKDNDAELEVDGKGQLKSNGQYLANINIKAKPDLNPQIKGALELVAKKRGINQYIVGNTGTLNSKYMNHLAFAGD